MDLHFSDTLMFVYADLNILSFILFGYDKLNAKAGRGRIPETLLLLVAAGGPSGALAAMVMFRHKTRHARFFLVPVFLLIHLLLYLWIRDLPSG